MAIINSITIGKGRGSIGNVTLSTKKSVTVARQKPAPRKFIPTPAQMIVQNKMKNVALLYNNMVNFLSYLDKKAKKSGSIYNYFVAEIVNKMPNAVYSDLQSLIIALTSTQIINSSWFNIVEINSGSNSTNPNGTEVLFYVLQPPIEDIAYMHLFCTDSETGEPQTLHHQLTFQELNEGVCQLPPILNGNDTPVVYVTGDGGYNCSNMGFGRIN